MPAAPADTPPPPTTPIDRDLPCHRCGYNLRTLATAGQCPECGEPVSASLVDHAANPAWLRHVARGCQLLVAGNALLIAGMATSAWGPFKEMAIPLAIGIGGFRIWLIGVSRQLAGFGTILEALPVSLSLLGVACTIAGTLLIARREPRGPASTRVNALRRLLMSTSLAATLLTLWMLAVAAGIDQSRRPGDFEFMNRGIWIVAAADPPHVVLLFLYLSHVAGRLRRPRLRHAMLATGAAIAATGAFVVAALFLGHSPFPEGQWGLVTSGYYPFAAAGLLSLAAALALARAAR